MKYLKTNSMRMTMWKYKSINTQRDSTHRLLNINFVHNDYKSLNHLSEIFYERNGESPV